MSFLEIVLLAVGLSMDSLAVSVTGGALIQNYRHHHMLKIGCVMGIFQAGMTIAGYLAGMSFKKYITAFDHWIAFLLLLYLGGKMIYESTQEKEEDCRTNPLCYKTLCGLGIATSIDALAVGDEVITNGGIAGKITKVADDFVVLEVSDTVEMKFQKGAIAATLPKGTLKAI